MSLSGQQRKKLQEALINAFPTKSLLEQMLSYELNKNLDEIAGGKDLQEIVFNLITKTEAEGWIEDLVYAARKTNPGNSKLQVINKTLANELSFRNYIQQGGKPNKNRFQIAWRVPANIGNGFTFSIVTICALIGIGIGIYLYKSYQYESIRLNSLKENKITIGNLIVAEKDKHYRIEITAYNPLKRDISVNYLKINRIYGRYVACAPHDYPHYIISDTVHISKLNQYKNRLILPIFPQNGSLSGAKYFAKGNETNVCHDSSLELGFDTSFLLKASSYTIFLIDIPKKLKVSQAKSVIPGEIKDTKTLQSTMTPEYLDRDVSFFKINLSMTTDTKQEISFTKNFIDSHW
ncbi:MAG: effector-associated domain EAD1-containing protein [Prochloraceae cyanobacterium]|nr:effector-associated domain EAD1-containing protein [Prochloraceae cyanobacterium]